MVLDLGRKVSVTFFYGLSALRVVSLGFRMYRSSLLGDRGLSLLSSSLLGENLRGGPVPRLEFLSLGLLLGGRNPKFILLALGGDLGLPRQLPESLGGVRSLRYPGLLEGLRLSPGW